MDQDNFVKALRREPKENEGDGLPIGLAENSDGTPFHCPTCEYYKEGKCSYDDPRLQGKAVNELQCCNRYERSGMKVLVK